jgi:light-regulated signal transduction histidine kinase (bacteriophytochrome)
MTVETVHSKELLECILESIGLGVIVTDKSGRFSLVNSAARTSLGMDGIDSTAAEWCRTYGLFQADGQTPLPDEENPLLIALGGASVDKLAVFVRNDKLATGAWCRVNARPLLSDREEQVGAVIVIEDFTEQKILADELSRSNRDLQQFAYVAAHDLQEPLRSITGFAELLQQRLGSAVDEKSADYLSRVVASAKRMQVLIRALLLFARVETRAKSAEALDCNDVVQDAIADLSSTIRKSGATIEVEQLPRIVGDASQLAQLFRNLIENAMKYRSEETPHVKISADIDGAFHRFKVSDNGIGIDMQYADRIFILFQRLHTRETYEGVGVGLSICKKIVERHGGRIWVESSPNQGSTFFFTIPRRPGEIKHAKE